MKILVSVCCWEYAAVGEKRKSETIPIYICIYKIGNIPNSVCFLGSDFSPLGKHRFEGWFAGAGIAYGYAWILSRHWNLEAEVGIGWAYTRFDKYDCVKCGQLNESNVPHHYIGPTKVAVNLVYVF